MDAVNSHASTRIDALRAEHGGMIEGRSAAKQARYRAILRQVPAPSLVPLKLPEVAIFRRGTASLRGHVYAEDGETFIYLNGWEADSISPETAKPSTIVPKPTKGGQMRFAGWRRAALPSTVCRIRHG